MGISRAFWILFQSAQCVIALFHFVKEWFFVLLNRPYLVYRYTPAAVNQNSDIQYRLSLIY